MASINRRLPGGSPLTKAQLDANFANLDTYKLTKTVTGNVSVILPSGTTAQRGSSTTLGQLRYNTETHEFEGYYSTGWNSVGARGYVGSAAPSAVGYKGSRGNTGSKGATGLRGYTGATGTTTNGATGPQGYPGANSAQGPQGPKGDTGPQGPTGSIGPTGSPGSSPNDMYYFSTAESKISNTSPLRLNCSGSAGAPGFLNTETGVTFNTNGMIAVSRNYSSTSAPYYFGTVALQRPNTGHMFVLNYQGGTKHVYGVIDYATPPGKYRFVVGPSGTGATLYLGNRASDYRLKENLVISDNNVNLLKKIKLYNFNFKDNSFKEFGFIAHQIQEHWPGAASGKKDGVKENGDPDYQILDSLSIIPLLLASVKELDNRINKLISKIRESNATNI